MIVKLNTAILSSKKIKIANKVKETQLTLNIINLVNRPKSKNNYSNNWLWDNGKEILWDNGLQIL